ncbi:rhodanese-like domain-containing protein [Candidatus Pelagibacter sp.]|nr:rhodanese-like domain-containing protein [Candidatus Pelagibacter sp.]
MSLVDTNWLEKNINNVKIIDCSWHMPQANRNGREEYNKEHIPNAIFFDLDKNSKIDTDLPHMLTDISSWEKIMEEMGIENKDEIVVYDNSDVISSCRCWYNLIYFGHDPKLVHVLDGGFKKWKKENKTTNNKSVLLQQTQFFYDLKKNVKIRLMLKQLTLCHLLN